MQLFLPLLMLLVCSAGCIPGVVAFPSPADADAHDLLVVGDSERESDATDGVTPGDTAAGDALPEMLGGGDVADTGTDCGASTTLALQEGFESPTVFQANWTILSAGAALTDSEAHDGAFALSIVKSSGSTSETILHSSAAFDLANGFQIAYWAKLDAGLGNVLFVSLGDLEGTNVPITHRIDPGPSNSAGHWLQAQGSQKIVAGVLAGWHHYSIVCDGSGQTVFTIDNESASAFHITLFPPPSGMLYLRIAGIGASGNVLLDEIVFNTATKSECSAP